MKYCCLIVFLFMGCAGPRVFEIKDADVQRFVKTFNTTDPLAGAMAFQDFEKHVPPAQRMDMLAQMWAQEADKEAPLMRLGILDYLINKTTHVPVGAPFVQDLLEARRHSDPLIRRSVLHILRRGTEPQFRNAVKDYLEDPDDGLREEALIEMRHWPNSRAVFEDYVKKHRKKKSRARSVEKAKYFLKKKRQK